MVVDSETLLLADRALFEKDGSDLGNDQEFESIFSSMAHSYVRSKAPNLMPYEQGFQLIERDDDDTKAFGVIGFLVGNQWLYAPLVYADNNCKGHDKLYVVDSDFLVPLKENWVNYFLNRKPRQLGKDKEINYYLESLSSPDLRRLFDSPLSPKYAADHRSWNLKTAEGRLNIKRAFAHMVARPMQPVRNTKPIPHLNDFVERGDRRVKQAFLKLCRQVPEFLKAYQRWYGENSLEKLRVEKQAASALDIPERLEAPAVKIAALEVFTNRDSLSLRGDLNPNETGKLLRDNVFIRDNRPVFDTSKIVPTEEMERMVGNPLASGTYRLLMRSGEFKDCMIFVNPKGPDRSNGKAVVVPEDETSKWFTAETMSLVTRQDDQRDTLNPYKEWFDAQSSTSALHSNSEGDVWMLVGPNGESSMPFRIAGGPWDQDDDTMLMKIYWVYHRAHGTPFPYNQDSVTVFDKNDVTGIRTGNRDLRHGSFGSGCCGGDDVLRLVSTTKATRMRMLSNELLAPESYKVVKLGVENYGHTEAGEDKREKDEAERSRFEPGTMETLLEQMMRKTASLEVLHDGIEVTIEKKAMMPIDALIHLVRDWGLREDDARGLLKKAEQKRSLQVRIKKAEPEVPFLQREMPSAPAPPALQEYGFSVPWSRTPAYEPLTRRRVIDTPRYEPPVDQFGVQAPAPNPWVLALAQQASQTQQQEVFDTSGLGALLKIVSDEKMIDEHIPYYASAMNRLGRAHLSLLWNREKWEDRYGKADLPLIEEALANNFDHLGDLILQLKEDQIGDAEHDLLAADVSEAANVV